MLWHIQGMNTSKYFEQYFSTMFCSGYANIVSGYIYLSIGRGSSTFLILMIVCASGSET